MKRIQDDVLNFELNLREFLVLSGKSTNDIISFYENSLLVEKREKNKSHSERRLNFFKIKSKKNNYQST